MNSIRNGLGMRETEITGNQSGRGIRISTRFSLKSITRSSSQRGSCLLSDSEALARKQRRRRLIERLNGKEKLIGTHDPARGVKMSEEELAAEIEKQRTLNLMRASFPSSS